MSHSRRRQPFSSTTCSGWNRGEQAEKRAASRAVRRLTRQALHAQDVECDADIPRPSRAFTDSWMWAKDGKLRFDPRRSPELLRK